MPRIRANGVDLNYELTGPTGAPVVALSNSLGTNFAMWDDVVPALRGRFRVLRYDTRGHGGSQVLDSEIEIADLAADLAGLLDALGIGRVHLAGLSLGGMTAQAFAATWPDRVISLTLMATAAELGPKALWDERIATVRAQGMAPITEATMIRWFSDEQREEEGPARIRKTFLGIDPIGYAVCSSAISRMDLRPLLSRIAAPTLILVGADDPATTVARAEAIRDGIGHAELTILPRVRHMLAVERGESIAAHLLAFLERYREPAAATLGGVPFDEAIGNRRAVLSDEHVDRSLAGAGDFGGAWQDFVTRIAWGEVWGDPRLPWKTRSLLTLAMMVALHREEEFKLHLRGAMRNGVTPGELQAMLLQCAVYGGVPAANAAFRWSREVLGDALG
jgi:3-oxoadipate enol-lactonase/4-carboxymuconolactone decarboxylase